MTMKDRDVPQAISKPGYGNPPKQTRFCKGKSGNPRGRPKGRHREPPYEAVLGRLVTVRDGGSERRMTAAEAFLLQLTKLGLEGDSAAARAAIHSIEEIRDKRIVDKPGELILFWHLVAPGSVNTALVPLRMASLLDQYRDTARILLEPWLVEAALARLERRLSAEEQQMVLRSTRVPKKVRWPQWWTEFPIG